MDHTQVSFQQAYEDAREPKEGRTQGRKRRANRIDNLRGEGLYRALTQALEAYLARCTGERRLDAKTIKAYKCDIEQHIEWLEVKRLALDCDTMRDYLVYLNGIWAASTVRRKLASLRAWCGWMRREHLIAVNPFDDLEISIRQPLLLPRTIGPSEMKRILMPGTNEAKRLKERKTVQTNAVKLRDQAILEMPDRHRHACLRALRARHCQCGYERAAGAHIWQGVKGAHCGAGLYYHACGCGRIY